MRGSKINLTQKDQKLKKIILSSKEKPKSELCAVEIKRSKYISCSKRYNEIKVNIIDQNLSQLPDPDQDISEKRLKKRNLETFYKGVINYFEEESEKVQDDYFLSVENTVKENTIEFASQEPKLPKRQRTRDLKYLEDYILASTKRRNLDMNSCLRKLNKYYYDGKLTENFYNDNFLLEKLVHLKDIKITYLNPVKEFRYLDYIFPLDRNLFLEEADNNYTSIFYMINKIKRQIKAEKKIKSKEVKLYQEDKQIKFDTNSSKKFNTNHMQYYKEWLLSLGNKRALLLKQAIDLHEKKQTPSHLQIENLAPIYINALKMIDSPFYSKRLYLKKLDKPTRDWVHSQYYIKRISEVCIKTGTYYLKYINVSEPLYKMLGIFDDMNYQKGFDKFIDNVQSCELVNLWINRFENTNHDWELKEITKPVLYSKKIRINNKCNQNQRQSSAAYQESYICRGKLYYKSIAKFFEE